MLFLCGRCNGKGFKTFKQYCERASELELQIEFAKKFGIPYNSKQEELYKIYKILDRGNKNETNSKRKETKW